jgi:hypothetical protein
LKKDLKEDRNEYETFVSVCTEEDLGNGGCLIYCNTMAKDGKEEPGEDFLGSTCTRSHEFCCEAPGGDPANCVGDSYTDDCAAKNSCCWVRESGGGVTSQGMIKHKIGSVSPKYELFFRPDVTGDSRN